MAKKRKVKRRVRSSGGAYGMYAPGKFPSRPVASSGGAYGMYAPGKFPSRRAKKRRTKRRPSPAQMRARRAFAARARARAHTGMAGRMRAGTRYNPRKGTAAEKAMYRRALRAAGRVAPRKKRRTKKRRTAAKGGTVTAAQVIAMAKKGALQRWLCKGKTRTGCGSTGRVVAGKGHFYRVRK